MANIGALITIAVGIFILAIVATIVPGVGDDIESANPIPAAAYATGTLTLTGNVTDGNNVTLTISGTSYRFEFDTNLTASEISAGGIEVDIGNVTPAVATANLTAAINANASTSAVLTATNPTSLTVLLTADDDSTTVPNTYGTTEDGAAMSFGAATLTGGVAGSNWNPYYNADMTSGADVWGDNISTVSTAAGIIVVGVIIGIVMGLQRKRG